MPALEAEAIAPNFSLFTIDGNRFSLEDARQSAPVVAIFFKVGCPTCQYAFPFIERIYKAYSKEKITFVGVSQDPEEDSAAFVKKYGVSFPILLDDKRKYPASNAYGLTNVPSIFVISPAGKVEFSSVGWIKPEIERLNQLVAKAAGVSPAKIFKPGEDVADFKAG